MMITKALMVALLLAGLVVPSADADDAADTAMRQRTFDLQRRAEHALLAQTGAARYNPAKALAWIDLALHELYEEDQTGRAAVIEHALAQAEKQLTAATPEAGFDTPLPDAAERVREDLWSKATELRANPRFPCAAREIAQLEVQLVWAGHEKWESGWMHAKPSVEQAENFAYEAEMAQRLCSTQPATRVEKALLNGGALFGFDQADVARIAVEGRARLDAFVKDVKRWKSIERIEVVGHADRIGRSAYNEKLSLRRAKNVRAYLIRRGLPADRIVASGQGARIAVVLCNGIASEKALRECLQANRRVEITGHGER